MKSKSLLPFAAVALVMFATAFVLFNAAGQAHAGSQSSAPAISVATTSATIAVGASTRVLASTTVPGAVTSYNRAYATICNVTSNAVFVLLNGDKPASGTNYTAVIGATSTLPTCFEVTDNRLIYNGSITASSSNQITTNVTVTDYVY
jgi:hypothetical protein